MGTQYSHLSASERAHIEVSHRAGASCAGIARYLGRNRSTVWRECQRGWCGAFGFYLAEFGRRYYAGARRNAGRLRRKLGQDLTTPAWRKSAVGTLVERTSRLTFLVKLDNASAMSVFRAFARPLRAIHPDMRKTLTYDRGTERSSDPALHFELGTPASQLRKDRLHR